MDDRLNGSNDMNNRRMIADTFLATMSHELRTPLNGIIGMVTMLPDAGPLNDKQKEYIKHLTECSLQLANLLNNIVDFSKMTCNTLQLQCQPFDIRQTVLDSINMVEGRIMAKKLQFTYNIPDNIPIMIGDRQRLIQVLCNVLGNSIKFTESGTISLIMTGKPLNDGYHRRWKFIFEVKDTGIGIPEEDQGKIFDAFHQSSALNTYLSRLGTGLGLSIVKEILRLMNGSVQVYSKGVPGEGSTFTFDITINEEIDIQRMSEVHIKLLNSKKILVVDDRTEIRMQLCDILFKWKCQPTAVSSAEEALQYLRNGSKYEVIIVDICMPYMSGIELAQEIRRLYSKIPLIAISSIDVDNGKKYFDHFMNKPINATELFSAIVSCLTSKSPESPERSPRERKKKRRKLRILIAEDDLQNIFTIREMLINLKYNKRRIEVAENGCECTNKVKNGKFDVVLMDLLMPICSGIEAAREIKKLKNPPMIIAVSAAVRDSDKTICQEAGFDGYLGKPILHKDKLDAVLSPLVKCGKLNKDNTSKSR